MSIILRVQQLEKSFLTWVQVNNFGDCTIFETPNELTEDEANVLLEEYKSAQGLNDVAS